MKLQGPVRYSIEFCDVAHMRDAVEGWRGELGGALRLWRAPRQKAAPPADARHGGRPPPGGRAPRQKAAPAVTPQRPRQVALNRAARLSRKAAMPSRASSVAARTAS